MSCNQSASGGEGEREKGAGVSQRPGFRFGSRSRTKEQPSEQALPFLLGSGFPSRPVGSTEPGHRSFLKAMSTESKKYEGWEVFTIQDALRLQAPTKGRR